jgi:hypothetical protein
MEIRTLPSETSRKSWRACLLCGLLKTREQFRRDGCDNCETILNLKGSNKEILECTSAQYGFLFCVLFCFVLCCVLFVLFALLLEFLFALSDNP